MKKKRMKIRNAILSDSFFLWSLRNAFDVRKISTNCKPIPFSFHKDWFKKKIKDKNCKIFIIDDNIGMVRYDINGKEAKVSIIISKDYRKKGIGTWALKGTMKKMKNYKLIAHILSKNQKSVRLFKKVGFNIQGD